MVSITGKITLPRNSTLLVFTDGAICTEMQLSGLAAIVKNEQGKLCFWISKCEGLMTCNEAEYAAVLMALEVLAKWKPRTIMIYTDSKIVADQVSGNARALSPALRFYCAQVRQLMLQYRKVEFIHIPREINILADALANEVLTNAKEKNG